MPLNPSSLNDEPVGPGTETAAEGETQAQEAHNHVGHARVLDISFAAFAFTIGLFLVVFPWMDDAWRINYFHLAYQWLGNVWDDPYFRGAITGLGLVNIYVGIWELLRAARRV